MKKVFLAIAFATSCVLVNAQESGATFGGKAGLNFSNLKAEVGDESETGDIRPSFHVGVFANIPFGGALSFSPELVYSGEGSKDEEDGEKVTQKLGYLNVPLLLKYNTSSGFFLQTGPQVGLLVGAKTKLEFEGEEVEVDTKDQFEKTAFSWTFGLGYKTTSGLGLDARYNLGLSNIIKESIEDGKLKSNVIQVNLTYTLGRK